MRLHGRQARWIGLGQCGTPAARLLLILLLSLFATLGPASPGLADAGTCGAEATNINFGNVSANGLQGATTTGTTGVGCPAGINNNNPWYFCTSIGVGSNSVSQTNRRLASGSSYISYQLYMDSGYANIFQDLGTDLYSGTYSYANGIIVEQTIYAKILSSALSIPPGTYTDSYSTGAQAVIVSNGGGGTANTVAGTCTGTSGPNYWNTISFSVSITLQASCSVSTTNINFGGAATLTNNIDSNGTVSVTCTSTTPYKISLGYGNGTGAGGSGRARYMPGPSGNQISYNLYSDSGFSSIWGNNLGVDTVSATGTGADQDFTVYGRVPPQSSVPVGYYSDLVVVTVTF
jgi:spore coat protein U-like protein